MLNDELSPLKAQINGASLTPPPLISKQKESDGMFAAGTAYGIGGVIPAAASLARTEQRNAQIRQANAQIDQINSAIVGAMIESSAAQMRIAKRIESFLERFKKGAHAPKVFDSNDAVFPHLHFSTPDITVSRTGTITVKVEVQSDPDWKMQGKPVVADGSVIAEIYDKDSQKIGEAALVFPVLGTGNSYYLHMVYGESKTSTCAKLVGMCLACGKPHGKYTVKFLPGDLWGLNMRL